MFPEFGIAAKSVPVKSPDAVGLFTCHLPNLDNGAGSCSAAVCKPRGASGTNVTILTEIRWKQNFNGVVSLKNLCDTAMSQRSRKKLFSWPYGAHTLCPCVVH